MSNQGMAELVIEARRLLYHEYQETKRARECQMKGCIICHMRGLRRQRPLAHSH
jgi:hypothetical protein